MWRAMVHANAGIRRAGFEPATFGSVDREHRTEVSNSQEVTELPATACTNACTDSPETVHADSSIAGRADAESDSLADVLRLLDRLPLTDEERADAVRRLLGGSRSGDPS